jgi:transcription initiation factor TFIID subunit 5
MHFPCFILHTRVFTCITIEMEDSVDDKSIIDYLLKRGYRHAEEYIKEDKPKSVPLEQVAFDVNNDRDVSSSNVFITSPPPQQDPGRWGTIIETQYSKLKKWIENSLDIYKVNAICVFTFFLTCLTQMELVQLLYPIFVHCYLDLISKNMSAEGK